MSNKYQSIPEWHPVCAQLSIDFALAIDHREFEKVVSLFTVDGNFVRGGITTTGRPALLKWLTEERPVQVIRHIISNFSGEMVKPDEVHGITYFTAIVEMGDPELPIRKTTPGGMGEWHNVFVKTSEGWRIKSKTVNQVFLAP